MPPSTRAVADARAIADRAASAGLLRCWARETGVPAPAGGVLRVDAGGARLEADVEYWSATGAHRFGQVRLDTGEAVDAVTVARLLVGLPATGGPAGPESTESAGAAGAAGAADLACRVEDSVRRVAAHVGARGDAPRGAPGDPAGTTPFLAAERALLLGHPMHPAPKSRPALTDAEAAAYSPELRGSFPLHWFAADRSVVSADSAWASPAERVVADLAGEHLTAPPGMVLIPAHPWQARAIRDRPGIRALLGAGLVRDLGPAGPDWYPTASLRTVYRADAPVMLKLSLGLPITNSTRENLRPELHRGVEIHRLLAAGLADELAAAHPGFGIVRDPGWVAVDVPGAAQSGLDAVIRDNPFGAGERVACVAGLVAERPDLGRSGLAARVEDLAGRLDRTVPDVAEEWFARYLDAVVVPVLWLYGAYGLGLEAHQQNTLVHLDVDGWPVGGWYRDNQGYYLSASRAGELERFLPGAGTAGDSRVADAVVDERIGYYVGINNVLGMIGAFGSQRLAAEHRLLARFRAVLRMLHAAHGNRLQLAATLAEEPTLRCKANLLTRIAGLDELVGPLEDQSVYVDIANPVSGVPAGQGR